MAHRHKHHEPLDGSRMSACLRLAILKRQEEYFSVCSVVKLVVIELAIDTAADAGACSIAASADADAGITVCANAAARAVAGIITVCADADAATPTKIWSLELSCSCEILRN